MPSDTDRYYELIKEPIDLSTIKARLDAGEYSGLLAVEAAFRLMFQNCFLYNDPTLNPSGQPYIVRPLPPFRYPHSLAVCAQACLCLVLLPSLH